LRPFSEGQPINYGIDFLLKMPLDYMTVYLMIFENNTIMISSDRYEEIIRLKFPSDYSKPKTIEDYKDKDSQDAYGQNNRIATESSSHKKKLMLIKNNSVEVRNLRAAPRQRSSYIQGISKNDGNNYYSSMKVPTKKKGTNDMKRLGTAVNKFISKTTIKGSERSFDIDTVDEGSEVNSPMSNKFSRLSKKVTNKENSSYGFIKVPKPVIKKKNPRIYGILGVDRLDPDDNILMRGNISSKKENSLSLSFKDREYISESTLKSQKARFYSRMHEVDSRLKKTDQIIHERRMKHNQENVSE